MPDDLLADMRRLIDDLAWARLPEGVTIKTTPSPEHFAVQSIYWSLEHGTRYGEIGVWEDGNSDLGLIDWATRTDQSEHRDLTGRQDLQDALAAVRDWVIDGRRVEPDGA